MWLPETRGSRGINAQLSFELDENAIADKIGHDWRNPESYDTDDGAAVGW